jgi:hypothetical protein
MAAESENQNLNTEQLLADWLREHGATFGPTTGILRIRRAQPRFAYHNYFARFKVETADFDGTGQDPSNITCQLVEVSVTDQAANAVPTACDSIDDL